METSNNIFGDSFLGSKWFSPDYLFNQGLAFFHQIFAFFSNNGAGIMSVYHTVLFIFSLFFLTVISYTSIRIFEIRSKEEKHLEHEIEESKDTAKKEGERLLLAAKAQIEQEMQQAKEGLRQQVADLALTAAEQILNAEIDKTKHQDIITKVSNQLS